jgi:hypothetical protein
LKLSEDQFNVGIEDENSKLIGFTRVLTDYIYKAIIFGLENLTFMRYLTTGIEALASIPFLKTTGIAYKQR